MPLPLSRRHLFNILPLAAMLMTGGRSSSSSLVVGVDASVGVDIFSRVYTFHSGQSVRERAREREVCSSMNDDSGLMCTVAARRLLIPTGRARSWEEIYYEKYKKYEKLGKARRVGKA